MIDGGVSVVAAIVSLPTSQTMSIHLKFVQMSLPNYVVLRWGFSPVGKAAALSTTLPLETRYRWLRLKERPRMHSKQSVARAAVVAGSTSRPHRSHAIMLFIAHL